MADYDLANMKESIRIGIFEYDWSMYSFTKDLIIKLAEAGYKVDVFQKSPNTSQNFTNAEQFKPYRQIRYFTFHPLNSWTRTITRKFKGLLRRLKLDYIQTPGNIIDREILQKSRQIVNESSYQCFIGIEKKGLVWAGILSRFSKCPVAYYSLELYLEDHPGLADIMATREYAYLRKLEKQYHQLCGATIIQDRLRAEALFKYNNVRSSRPIYLPISVRGSIVEKKSSFFHQKFGIDQEKNFVLYFGLIQDARFSTSLVEIARCLQDHVMLVLHGYGDPEYLAHLQSIAAPDRVAFSLDLVEEEKILDVISSASIGLALYENTNSNDRLAAFSSVKVAYYMQCGVPVIAFDSESFRELMKAYQCGELIHSIDEIPEKVEKILKDYACYQEQAIRAFQEFYNFDENFVKFSRDFDQFIKSGLVLASKTQQ